MSVRNPEDWLPQLGISQMESVQIATSMAIRCVDAYADDNCSMLEQLKSLENYAVAVNLSCPIEKLPEVIITDLTSAGIDYESASLLAGMLPFVPIPTQDKLPDFIRLRKLKRDIVVTPNATKLRYPK